MFFDADAGGREAFARTFDVCVVGSGPAGITLARRLAAQGLDVALMEAGDFDMTVESQDLYMGENVGQAYFEPDITRLRFFGGTSGHWSGRCRALDAHDFVGRPYHALSGWPIAKADLDRYQPAAAAILDLDDATELPDLPVVQAEDRLRQIQWRLSPPTRLGTKYRDEIVAAERIALCLNANLVDLRLSDDLRRVTGAVFKSYTPGDPGFTVQARSYALCMGGLENARMLLNFRSQMPQGVGNGHDLVGRYFCEHPSTDVADVVFTAPQDYQQVSFAPILAFMEAEQIQTYTIFVEYRRERPPQELTQALSGSVQCVTPFVEQLLERMRGKSLKCHWGGVQEYLIRRDPLNYPYGKVWMAIEQALNPDSRVLLAEEKDMFGLQRLQIDWRLSELDYRTLNTATLAFGAHLAEQDIGRLKLRDWMLDDPVVLPGPDDDQGHVAGLHHMCTTRMSDDPRQGVVDRNCRVHGMGNLFIGGSSVFATGGFANPTHTIVQLALRLGDHLGREMHA